MKTYLTILLSLLFIPVLVGLVPVIIFAATNDFVADANIVVAGVTFGATTADMIIFDDSTAESWTFNSGVFTVTSPGSAFHVGSSDSNVKSMKILNSGGSVLVCTENTTLGTSYATLPTSSGTYTIEPSTITDCTTLCTTLSNTASYNSYPTCGAASCNAGYKLSGSSSSATCVPIGGGGVLGGGGGGGGGGAPASVYTVIPGTQVAQGPITPSAGGAAGGGVSAVFTKVLNVGVTNSDVKRLQQLLNSDPTTKIAASGAGSPGKETNYFGPATTKAVQKFQCKYGIVCSGTPKTTGYGNLGPKTRTKIQAVFGK